METDRETETEEQTDRQAGRQRQTDKQRHREIDKQAHRQTQTERQRQRNRSMFVKHFHNDRNFKVQTIKQPTPMCVLALLSEDGKLR